MNRVLYVQIYRCIIVYPHDRECKELFYELKVMGYSANTVMLIEHLSVV